MYGGCVGKLGVMAPMGLNFQPGYAYSAPLNIGQAWQQRVIEPRWPISSTGLGVFTGGSYLPPESTKVATSEVQDKSWEEMFQGLVQGVDKIFVEQGIELPGWMQQIYDRLPRPEEEKDMPEVTVQPPVQEPSFFEKHGKLLLWGGGAVLVFYLLRKG